MKPAPYRNCKPSGVEWLGEVPEHWETKPLGRLTRFMGGATPDKSKPEYWEGDIPWVSPKDMKRRRIEDALDHVSIDALRDYPLRLLPESSVLIVVRGMILAHSFPVALTDSPLTINQDMKALTCGASVLPGFLAWSLTGLARVLVSLADESAHGTRKLGTEVLARFPLPTPAVREQAAIADFLDRETAKIDTLVARKRTLIERLKEKHTALISRTVTRGLPPDAATQAGLEAHPNLKLSGIDWLGDVPEHWEIKAIKWESPVSRGASPRPIDNEIYFDDEGEYAWVRIADVSAAGMYLVETTQRLSPLGKSLSVPLEPGALFLSIAGSVGKPCITRIKCCIHDGFVYFPRWHGDARFLYYVFASGEPYQGLGKLGTQLNLNTDTIGSIVSGFPPVSEQRAIADFLDRETAKIDAIAAKVEAAIERLQEYRTALITAAVTGKIDVRAMARAGITGLGDAVPGAAKLAATSRDAGRAGGRA